MEELQVEAWIDFVCRPGCRMTQNACCLAMSTTKAKIERQTTEPWQVPDFMVARGVGCTSIPIHLPDAIHREGLQSKAESESVENSRALVGGF